MIRRSKTLTQEDRVRCALIAGLYRLVHRRVADTDGIAGNLRRLRKGARLPALIEDALRSDEFRRRHPEPVRFPGDIDALFADAFGREPPRLDNTHRHESVSAYAAALIAAENERAPIRITDALYPDGIDPEDDEAYQLWLADYQTPHPTEIATMRAAAARWPDGIAVSLILLAGSAHWAAVAEAIASVQAQLVPRFELIVVGTHALCEMAVRTNPAIKMIATDAQDFVSGFNAAMSRCAGEFLFVVRPDLRLASDAAYHIGQIVHADPTRRTTALYCDCDKIDSKGRRYAPTFHSGWDPDLAFSHPDWAHALLLRTSVVQTVGGARPDYAECAPEDLALRVIATAGNDRVRHIPRVLVSQHVRKSWTDRFRPATTDHRRFASWSRLVTSSHSGGPTPSLVAPPDSSGFRVVYLLPATKPLVSIIIPTRNKLPLLRDCINGLLSRTEYRPFEIVVVDNRSQQADTLRYLSELENLPNVRVLQFDAAFNWGAINNFGVRASNGEVVLLLNNDTDVIHSDWLTELSAQAMRPDIGVVGAKLLYQNQTVQHAGMVFGPDGYAFHRFRHLPANEPGYGRALVTVRNVTAVTGACLAIRRNVFDEIGGIEDQNLAVTWSDVDLCLRARARSYRVIITPYARMMHLELATRGADDTPERQARADRERDYMLKKWPVLLDEDSFFNPSFRLADGDTRLATPPRPPRRLTAQDE
jgi:GT2 family glycosyltransferase